MSRIKYIAAGAIVLLQLYHPGAWEIFFKVENIGYISASPLVYALVVISDHTQVMMLLRKHFYESVLYSVGILIFVNHYVSESLLIFQKHRLVCLKEPDGVKKQIVKVHGIVFFESALIGFEHFIYGSGSEVLAFIIYIFLRAHAAVFA